MKLIFTVIALIATLAANSIDILVDSFPASNKPPPVINVAMKKNEGNKLLLVGRPVKTELREPLLIVDGVPVDFKEFHSIRPTDIESINILKEDNTSIIGCRRNYSEVIIITTKPSRFRKFIIKDFLTGEPIPGATISVFSSSDTIKAGADDSGILVMKNLNVGQQYAFLVSSTGYLTLPGVVKTNIQEILMTRDIKICPEVVVVGYPPIRCYRLYMCPGVRIKSDSSSVSTELPVLDDAKKAKVSSLYPNPVQRHQIVNLEINGFENEMLTVSVTGIDGKRIWQQSSKVSAGLNRLAIATDARWTAGIYIIQLQNTKGKIVVTEKLIVQ